MEWRRATSGRRRSRPTSPRSTPATAAWCARRACRSSDRIGWYYNRCVVRPLLRVDSHPRFRLEPSSALGNAQVVVHLQAKPELWRYPEILAEAQRSVGSDGAFAVDNVADPVWRNGDLARERVDAHLHRLHEFLVEDFAGVDRFK